MGFPGGSKESTCNAGDMGSIPGWGRSPAEGNGSPLQYSYLGNPMDRGAWASSSPWGLESQTWLSNYTTTTSVPKIGHYIHFSTMGFNFFFLLKFWSNEPLVSVGKMCIHSCTYTPNCVIRAVATQRMWNTIHIVRMQVGIEWLILSFSFHLNVSFFILIANTT